MPGHELVDAVEQLGVERQGNFGFGHRGMTIYHTIQAASVGA
jgi:hypothetical protein